MIEFKTSQLTFLSVITQATSYSLSNIISNYLLLYSTKSLYVIKVASILLCDLDFYAT